MKLKLILSTTLLLGISMYSSAQITVGDYERQISANIEELPQGNPVPVNSTCGKVAFSIDDKLFSGGCAGTLVRTYTFTDDCGNTATAQQFIKLIDTTAPKFNAESVVYAGTDGSLAPEQIEVTDNSKIKLNATYTDKEKKDHILRTWTVTDDCGNTSTFEQKLLLKEEL